MGGNLKDLGHFTFDRDNVHALYGVQRAEACIDGTVADLPLLPAGPHDSACSTPSLATSQLCPSQAKPCKAVSKRIMKGNNYAVTNYL